MKRLVSPALRFALLPLLLWVGACTSQPETHTALPPLTPGKPLLASMGAPTRAEITRIQVSVRFPSVTPWQAEIFRSPGAEGGTQWRVRRSDRPGAEESADDLLVAHFLETLESVVVEGEAGKGTDETFGFKPHRIEVRLEKTDALKPTPPTLLRFGDPVGGHSLFFRRDSETRTWIARGAWMALLPNLQASDAFSLKNYWTGKYEDLRRVRLEKHLDPAAGAWEITREPPAPGAANDYAPWKQGERNLSAAQIAVLERVLRQRTLDTAPGGMASADSEPDFSRPDWTLTLDFAGSPPQTFLVFFPLGRVVGKSAAADGKLREFHPEFAGALRAFTQSRFTPVKSRTKK